MKTISTLRFAAPPWVFMYIYDEGSVLYVQGHMNETLTHELVHSYDYCRAKLDWNDLHHLACTEVGVVCGKVGVA